MLSNLSLQYIKLYLLMFMKLTYISITADLVDVKSLHAEYMDVPLWKL